MFNLVISVSNFMIRYLNKNELVVKLRIRIQEHRLHPDHLHVVLLLVGEKVVVEYHWRNTLNSQQI